jgi:hypothetical protein
MTLKQEYEHICNRYLVEFANKYELSLEPDAWVGGDVGTVAYVSDYYFGFDDIRRCVDENVKWQDLIEWYDYNCEGGMLGLNQINLKSWLMGAPRADKETIAEIKARRKELEELIKNQNEKNGGLK